MKLILSILAILYALSPYDLLPDFAVGWGWIDDLIILGLLIRYLYTSQKSRSRYDQYSQYQQGSGTSDSNSTQDPQETYDEDDPYKILGINRDASVDEIKAAYRELANKYHPDKVQHLGKEFKQLAENRFKAIQEAYDKLKVK